MCMEKSRRKLNTSAITILKTNCTFKDFIFIVFNGAHMCRKHSLA